MPSIREQCLAAIATKLGVGTLRGPIPSDIDTTIAATSVVDGGDTGEADRSGAHQLLQLTFIIDSYAKLGGTARETKLDELWSGAYDAIMSGDRTLGGIADGIKYQAATLDYATDDSDYVRAQLTFIVLFKFDLEDSNLS